MRRWISQHWWRYLADCVTCWWSGHDPVRRVGKNYSGMQCARCGEWVA